ncbi:MAG: hypothetical protein OWU33_02450 [Firmicutes bacterium]|nr:hypothetical protein [Bacillota bacterium]
MIWALAVTGFAFDRHNLVGWVILFVATGLATGVIEIAQKKVTVDIVPASSRGRSLGEIAAIRGFGQLLASVMIGTLWTLGHPGWGFVAEGGWALAGVLMMTAALRHTDLSGSA